jgi:hypothetical protein
MHLTSIEIYAYICNAYTCTHTCTHTRIHTHTHAEEGQVLGDFFIPGWIRVKWDADDSAYLYRWGVDHAYDLEVVGEQFSVNQVSG